MENYELISAKISDPQNAMFKSLRNNNAECSTYTCNNKNNCELFAKGECTMMSFFKSRCPYGEWSVESGPTKRARSYREWITTREKKYADFLYKLKSPTERISIIGDYVYLPYAHMNMNKEVPFLGHSNIFSSGECYVKREHFNLENIRKIISFRPHAMMGGEITDYQKKSVPKFLSHMQDMYPDLFIELLSEFPNIADIVKSISPIGRTALLSSIRPGVVFTKYKNEAKLETQYWTWDGVYLNSENKSALSFTIVPVGEAYIQLKPKPNAVIKIDDIDQVDGTTLYMD